VNRPLFAPRLLPLALALSAALAASPVLAQSINAAPDATFEVTGFEVMGDNPLNADATQAALRPFVGPNQDIYKLEAAREALAEAIRSAGLGLYRVVLPPQDAVGTIKLTVTKIPLVAINVAGEKYFSEANIRASLPALVVGDTPDMRIVARDLELANDDTAKHTALRFGEAPDGSGIVANVDVTDKSPWSLTVGANNTGDPAEGGETRILAYLQYANLFNLDQTLGFAYTTAPNDTSGVKQYGIYYKAPIYAWGGVVSASHSYSTTSSGALGSGQVITGAGTIDGIAYTQLLSPIGAYKSSLALGLDDKLFRSPTLDQAQLTGGDVRSRPISLAYTGNYEANWGTSNFNIEIDHNLGSGSHNDEQSYNANRVGANNDWNALRVNYSLGVPLPRGFALNVRLVGQYSSDALIQGEEFGLGGASSIRGAEERAVVGDSGASSSLELYTPDLGYNVKLLAFSDNGFVTRHDPVVGQSSRDQLQSLGVGLRWTYLQSAQFALDYGYIVHGSEYPTIPSGTQRLHANLLYTFN